MMMIDLFLCNSSSSSSSSLINRVGCFLSDERSFVQSICKIIKISHIDFIIIVGFHLLIILLHFRL